MTQKLNHLTFFILLIMASCTKDNDPVMPPVHYTSPEQVYSLFKQINQVPRPSWHEEKATQFLQQFAAKLNLECKTDKQGCVVIKKPASTGHENAPTVVLLNHMDMVCVAEAGKNFNPLTDPIESYIDNGWIKARGTSLGADNGIGLSMALAVLQSNDIIHGPLECIFTTNEEDGMTGAAALSPDFISGRLILNLDSEDYDVITVGSAAAYLQFTTLPFTTEPAPDNYSYFKITLKGGKGGHSGVDINKGRASANKVIGEFLYQTNLKHEVRLCSFNGGEANNSIPVNLETIVGVPVSQKELFTSNFESYATEQSAAYKATDPGLIFSITPINTPQTIIDKKATDGLLTAIHQCPFGALKMSTVMENTVETSNNFGVIKTNESSLFISNYSRSFIDAEVEKLAGTIKGIFDAAGAQTELIMSAPGWEANLTTPLLKLTEESFMKTLGFAPKKVAMHFALESGYFIQKYPGCQIVSIGPKIIEPHSLTERVDMQTIDNIWKVLINMLYELAK